MPILWSDPTVRDRLLAAIIASFEGNVWLPPLLLLPTQLLTNEQINCKEVARLFGQDATYNAIENFLRKPKKEAAKLRAEAMGTTAPAPSPARPRSTTKKIGTAVDGG